MMVDLLTESSDVGSRTGCSRQQLSCGERNLFRVVFRIDAMTTTLLAYVFAQQLVGFRIENANVQMIPLHFDKPADPSRWYAIESGVDFDATIQVNDALAVLV